MFRIIYAIVALAAYATAAADTPVSVEAVGSTVTFKSQGEIEKVQHFVLRAPLRLVVDLYGTHPADPSQDIPLSNGFERLRIGSYPDKTRFVFDVGAGAFPSYGVNEGERQVVVTWEGESRPAVQPATARPATPAAGGRARVTAVEITDAGAAGVAAASLAGARGYQARISLEPFAGLGRTEQFVLRAPNRLVVDLYGVRPGPHPRSFPLQGGFDRLRVGDALNKTRFVFDVEGDRWPTFELSEDPQRASILISWHAPAGVPSRALAVPSPRPAPTGPEQAAPEPLARPALRGPDAPPSAIGAREPETAPAPGYSGVRTTLVYDDAEIRDVLARIAEVSGRRIVVDESVTGTLMVRLVNVPWDQALEMILDVTGLRAVEDGQALRITRPPAGAPPDQELVNTSPGGAR